MAHNDREIDHFGVEPLRSSETYPPGTPSRLDPSTIRTGDRPSENGVGNFTLLYRGGMRGDGDERGFHARSFRFAEG